MKTLDWILFIVLCVLVFHSVIREMGMKKTLLKQVLIL